MGAVDGGERQGRPRLHYVSGAGGDVRRASTRAPRQHDTPHTRAV